MTVNDSTAKMNWDLTSYFPEFNGPEMKEFKEKLKGDIQTAKEKASPPAPPSPPTPN